MTRKKTDNRQPDVTRRNFVTATSAAAFLAAAAPVLGVKAGTNMKVGKNFRWVDSHCHVSDIGAGGKKRTQLIDDMLDVLDRCDADLRMVISPDEGIGYDMRTDPSVMLAANRVVYDLCRLAPKRLYGCCTINPKFTDEALRVMKICFEEWGFVQMGEMLTYTHNYDMCSPEGEKVTRAAAKYDIPVQVHIGTYTGWRKKPSGNDTSGEGLLQLCDLMRLNERVPEAKYVLAHAIGCGPTRDYLPWAGMILDTLNGAYEKFPRNFWIEIRDFHCPALPRTLREVPVDRLLCGTDWASREGPPFQNYGTMFGVKQADNPFPPGVSSFVGFLRKAGASESDIAKIAYENAKELYKFKS